MPTQSNDIRVLLHNEQQARIELLEQIDNLSKSTVSTRTFREFRDFLSTAERILVSVKSFMDKNRELTDLLRVEDMSNLLKMENPTDIKCPKCSQCHYILAHVCNCGYVF